MKIIIATIREWNVYNAYKFKEKYVEWDIKLIFKREDFYYDVVMEFDPDYIFFPHWSYYIPEEVYTTYKCIVFHPSRLPYGRGGSPIQNQIIRGIKQTVISAISVREEVDAGDIYMQRELSLLGSAQEIFMRMSDIVFREMIPYIIEHEPQPKPQEGIPVVFKRRKPIESILPESGGMKDIYDFIRMLDADGYPNAFIQYGNFIFSFSKVSLGIDSVEAKVVIKSIDEK